MSEVISIVASEPDFVNQCVLTVGSHADGYTFLEPALLTLVASVLVNDATLIPFAVVFQTFLNSSPEEALCEIIDISL